MGNVVGGIVWVLFVAMAIRPPFRGGTPGFVCFLLTMTVIEVPMVLLVLITAPVVLGSVGTPPGALDWLSYLMFSLVVLGLVWLQARARTARPALGQAVEAGLGPQWRTTVAPTSRRRDATSRPWLGGILLPFQRHRRDVLRLRNLSYGPHGRAHLLDVYRSRDDAAGRPILVHLHSGGFVQGGKSREGVTMLNQLAAHGWLCVSANYRLRADAAHPNPLVDAKRVIGWVRAHAAEHGADPSRVFLVGSSAGAHLAASAALTANDPRLQPGFEDADTTVSGVVSLYGYLGPRTADSSSAPAALVAADAPPFLVVEAGNDTMLPPGGAEAFVRALRAVSTTPTVHAVLPGAQHNFDFYASVRARIVADEVEGFLDRLSTQPRPT